MMGDDGELHPHGWLPEECPKCGAIDEIRVEFCAGVNVFCPDLSKTPKGHLHLACARCGYRPWVTMTADGGKT